MKEKGELRKLPKFLHPRLRLFLSADLVGSTAFKQKPLFPLSSPETIWGETGLSPKWLTPISDFLVGYTAHFLAHWDAFKKTRNASSIVSSSNSPRLWKANGDELIFVMEISDRREVYVAVDAFRRAVLGYRKIASKDHGLDVKAAAWTAGFPVMNSEILLNTGNMTKSSPYEGDPRLIQFDQLEKYFKGPKSKNSGVALDFIGPSIDTGFRIAAQATPRKFMLSIELAYLLSTSTLPGGDDEYLKWFNMKYDGAVVLKGVMAGKPYPMFWIDAMEESKIVQLDDKILGKKKDGIPKGDVEAYCLEFFKENSKFFIKPFAIDETPDAYGELPDNYVDCILELAKRWENEKTRANMELNVGDDIASSGQTIEPDEIVRLLSK